jgi:hypothetical protein
MHKKTNKKFSFYSIQKHEHKGKKYTKKISVKNGKSHKIISCYHGGKIVNTSKNSLSQIEISLIKLGKILPNLFKSCSCNKTKKFSHHNK